MVGSLPLAPLVIADAVRMAANAQGRRPLIASVAVGIAIAASSLKCTVGILSSSNLETHGYRGCWNGMIW